MRSNTPPHFDISKKGFDTTPHVHTAAPHGRVTREASNEHVHQDTRARRIKTKQVGPPGAEMVGSTRIFKSALHAPSIAELSTQKHIPQLLLDCVVCRVGPALLRTVVQVAAPIAL